MVTHYHLLTESFHDKVESVRRQLCETNQLELQLETVFNFCILIKNMDAINHPHCVEVTIYKVNKVGNLRTVWQTSILTSFANWTNYHVRKTTCVLRIPTCEFICALCMHLKLNAD